MSPKMKKLATLLFLALFFTFGMKSGESQLCSFGTVEMEKCSIQQCTSDCRNKVSHCTGRCIAIDTCCCVARPTLHN
ncbi:unnamed protein product [Amaranthus hypochondriacus]